MALREQSTHALWFFENHVVPNVEDWREHGERWRGVNSAIALNQLVDYRANELGMGLGKYRGELIKRCPKFEALRSVAESSKHEKLDRGEPWNTNAWQVVEWHDGMTYGPSAQVMLLPDDEKKNTSVLLSDVIDSVFSMWQQELQPASKLR